MLLELYDRNHKKLANLTGIKSPHIQRTLEYGDETLDFSYPTSGPWLAQLLAECYIRTDRQEYVVKAVEKSSTSAWRKVSCALNIEELEGAPFEGFETVEQTVQAAAEFALEGTGWTVETDADITKKRTIRKEDDTTAWEVVKQIVDTYRVELEIDAVNKRLLFHTRRGRDRGAYFIERLNLRSLGVKTSSYGFYTRLIPIGKDGLHLWRDGQNYIENHQYSDKVITSIWRDERYTVTAALLEDAQARLDEASAPARAYTAELVDLAAQSDKYNALAYDLGDAVLLVSEKTDEREKQRIVKLDEYPDDPLANKAELSNVKQTFAQLQKTEAEMATADAVAIATKRTKKVLKDDYLTKKETEVKISALAESIELEVSKTYMTVANGQAAIDKALEAGKQYTDGKLTEYSTTEETKSLISQSAEQITLEVSKTYATTASVEKSLDTLQAAAKSAQETADKANNDAANAQAAADKAATDAAAAAAEADKAKQAAEDFDIPNAAEKLEDLFALGGKEDAVFVIAVQASKTASILRQLPDGAAEFGALRIARADKPGIRTRVIETDMARTEKMIREARFMADYVIVSIHSHECMGAVKSEPAEFCVEFAHRCIDAGAHAIVGTGPHMLRPIEIYKGCPIFYSLGDFIIQLETVKKAPVGFFEKQGMTGSEGLDEMFEKRSDHGRKGLYYSRVMFEAVVPYWEAEDGKLRKLKLLPVELGFGKKRSVGGWPAPDAHSGILERLAEMSLPYGTKIEIGSDGTGTVLL